MAGNEQPKVVVPEDIREVYSMLRSIRYDLTDTMLVEFNEWIAELKYDITDAKQTGCPPDWDNYRSWMNDICANDGMPALFDKVEV